ncbi:hypothetical protein [Anatilimnocola floriformis]|uniref:hypothetical protein n=1 Tax=Anatilimnocola floriformis TaxID=2948575 RepID=UPI0020C33304|nr:hypothetical protein [Anatilimnocola floriformis]
MFRACLIVFLLAAVFSFGALQSPAAPASSLPADVAKLLRERLEHLRYCANAEKELYDTGRGTLERLIHANRQVVEAELELASTPAERIQARETLLKHAETLELSAKTRHDAGLISTADLRSAQAMKLRAQADLLLEKKAAAK